MLIIDRFDRKISGLTSIQRWVDLRYPTNLAIAGLSLGIGALAFFIQIQQDTDLLDAFSYSFNVAVTFFLSWALARELDPDRDYSAFLAAGLGLLGFFIYGPPDLLSLLLVLVSVRVINRTVGPPATVFDSLILLGLGSFLTLGGDLASGLLASGAFLLDGFLFPQNRRNLFFAGLMAIFVVVYWILEAFPVKLTAVNPNGYLILGLVTVMFVPVIYSYRRVRSVCDRSGVPLDPTRVRTGMVFALLSGWIAWILGEWQILQPLWMAIAAVGFYYLLTFILYRVRGVSAP